MEVYDLRRSTQRNKKYAADVKIDNILYRNVNFGDNRYEHYKDSTPLKLYSHLNHNDLERRRLFHTRHKNNTGPASMLAKEFLW